MNILTIYAPENKYGGLYINVLSMYSQLYTDTKLNIDDNRIDEYEIIKKDEKESVLSNLKLNYIPDKLYIYNIYIPIIYIEDLNNIISYLGINKEELEIKDIELLKNKPKKDNTKKKRWWNKIISKLKKTNKRI